MVMRGEVMVIPRRRMMVLVMVMRGLMMMTMVGLSK